MSVFWNVPASDLATQLTPQDWEQIHSLRREKDPEMEGEGWLFLARRWESEGKLELASSTYSAMIDSESPGIRLRAQQGLDALSGRGHFGLRFESTFNSLVRESQDYRNWLLLLAGESLVRAARPALHRFWTSRQAARFLHRARPEIFSGLSGTSAWGNAYLQPRALAKPPGNDIRNLFLTSRMSSSKSYTYSQDRMWEWVFDNNRPIHEIARSINGSYLTGNVHDLELAQKFVRFYRQLPYYRHPGAVAKVADESLGFRLQLTQRRYPLEPAEFIKLLQWRQTSSSIAALPTDLAEGKLEVVMKQRQDLEMIYSDPAFSLFIPPGRGFSPKPQIWILEVPVYLETGEMARQILLRASDLVHEYEHFRHYRELDLRKPDQKLRAEMRAWLEEYLFRMHHGDLGFYRDARLESPRDFGMYFRRWVERIYGK